TCQVEQVDLGAAGGGEPVPIGAEGGRAAQLVKRHTPAAGTLEIVPVPEADLRRAAVEQDVGEGHVVRLPRRLRLCHAAAAQRTPRVVGRVLRLAAYTLGPLLRDLGDAAGLLRPLALLGLALPGLAFLLRPLLGNLVRRVGLLMFRLGIALLLERNPLRIFG